VDEVALEQFSLQFRRFFLLIIMLASLRSHLSSPHEVCDSPDQAAYYHILGSKLEDSSLARHLAGLGVKIV
jgi:hypothetical protein